MQWLDILVIVAIIVAIICVALYFLNKWAGKKMVEQQDMIQRNKTAASIYVIDKKKEKAANANFPKAVYEQMPKFSRMMKIPLVKAKVGAQIMTLMCDKDVFNALPIKKTIKVEMAGMYIVSMKGMKTKKEMAEFRKSRKASPDEGVSQPIPWYKNILSKFAGIAKK